MADQAEPGLVPVTPQAIMISQVFVGFAIGFLAITSFLFVARVYARTRPVWSVGWDDWIAGVAFTLASVEAALALVANNWSLKSDNHFIHLSTTTLISKVAFSVSLIGAWSVAAIKISVAFLFLRFKRAGIWTNFLYTMIATQVVTAIFVTIMQGTRYIPFYVQYSPDMELRKSAQVWSDRAFAIGIAVSSTSNIATDIIFSLLPIVLIRDIQRPRREKIIVGILMGLGFIASGASIAKTIAVSNIGKTGDFIAEGTKVGLFSLFEEQLGILVACVPCLRALMQRVLKRYGIISSHTRSQPTRSHLRSGQMYTQEASESQKEIVVVSEIRVEHDHTRASDEIELEGFNQHGRSRQTFLRD